MHIGHPRLGIILFAALLSTACNDPARPCKKQGRPIETSLLCSCKPTHVTKDDWRIELKNEPLPKGEPQDTTVGAILAWPEGPEPGPRTQRTGKELSLFHVGKAYLQTVFFRRSDCDLHMEVSEQPDKNAPRMIIETPGTTEYCLPRTNIYSDLQQHGIMLTYVNQDLAQPLSVEIIGTPFRDQDHPVWFARGSDKVATLWELHPAKVRVIP